MQLKSIRRKRHISQAKLAEKIGVTTGYISRVENGTKSISLPLATEIADYLDVSLDEIAGRKFRAEPQSENFLSENTNN